MPGQRQIEQLTPRNPSTIVSSSVQTPFQFQIVAFATGRRVYGLIALHLAGWPVTAQFSPVAFAVVIVDRTAVPTVLHANLIAFLATVWITTTWIAGTGIATPFIGITCRCWCGVSALASGITVKVSIGLMDVIRTNTQCIN